MVAIGGVEIAILSCCLITVGVFVFFLAKIFSSEKRGAVVIQAAAETPPSQYIPVQRHNIQSAETPHEHERMAALNRPIESTGKTIIQNITYNIQDSSIVADEFGRVSGGNDGMGLDNQASAPESEVRPPIMDENSETRVSANAGERTSSDSLPSETTNPTGESTTKSCPICMRFVSIKATECDCGFVFDG